MDVLGVYSFNKGLEEIKKKHLVELKEVVRAIRSVDSTIMKTKVSKEKTNPFSEDKRTHYFIYSL